MRKERSPRGGSGSATTASTRASGGASVRRPSANASSAPSLALDLGHDAVAVVQDEAAEPAPRARARRRTAGSRRPGRRLGRESGGGSLVAASNRARPHSAIREGTDVASPSRRGAMLDDMTRVIEPGALEALVAALARAGLSACSARRVRTARSSTTSSSPRPSCRSAGPTTRSAGTLPARAARRRRALRLCGRAALLEAVPAPAAAPALAGASATATAASRSRRNRPTRRRSRSSACAPASCTRSRSRTRCSSAAATSTATTRRGARAPSSSPSTASSPAAPASASRWAPGRRPRAATTSR